MNAPLAKEQIALLMSDSLTYRVAPVQGTSAARSERRSSALAGVARRVSAFLRMLAELPQRRAVLDELANLSDRELADIGLNRADLKVIFKPNFARG